MDTTDGINLRIDQINREIELKEADIEKLKESIVELKVQKVRLMQKYATNQIFDMVGNICQDYITKHPKL